MDDEKAGKRKFVHDWDHWERLIDSATEPVAVVDAESIVHYCNQHFRELAPGLDSGNNFLEHLNPINQETLQQFHHAYSGHKIHYIQLALRGAEGVRWLRVRVLPASTDGVPARYFVHCNDVTDIVSHDEELRRRDAMLQKAEQLGSLASWSWNVKEDQGYWSDNLYRMTGYEPQSLVPNYDLFLKVVHPDDREMLLKHFQAALEPDQSTLISDYQLEFRLVKTQSGHSMVLGRIEVERDVMGNAVNMSGVLLDITDRQQIQEELRISKERWQFALENAGDGVWDWNPQTEKVFFSKRWKSMIGFEDHEIGTSRDEWSKRVHPDDLPRCFTDLEEHFSGRVPFYHNEHRVRCKDGSYKWILARGKVVERNTDGSPKRIIGTHTDMTDRRKAEQDLKQSEALLDAAGRMAKVGGWEVDAKTLQVAWTKETYRIHEVPFDYKPRVADAINFYHPDDRPIIERAVDNAINHGVPFDLELRFITGKGRELFTRAICTPVYEDGKVAKLIGNFHDITEIKQMELALIAANEKLKRDHQLLEEQNIAMRVVLSQIQEESNKVKQQIAQNMDRIIKPALAKLRASIGDRGRPQLDALEAALTEVTSPFVFEVERQFINLTPREMEICNHIKNGLRSKEIADLLNISVQTVEKFRQKIRKKLKIEGTSANLSSFLRSLKS